jgi:hypothetical protein
MQDGNRELDRLVQSARTVDQPSMETKKRIWERLAPTIAGGAAALAATTLPTAADAPSSALIGAASPTRAAAAAARAIVSLGSGAAATGGFWGVVSWKMGIGIGMALVAAGVFGTVALGPWRSPAEPPLEAPVVLVSPPASSNARSKIETSHTSNSAVPPPPGSAPSAAVPRPHISGKETARRAQRGPELAPSAKDTLADELALLRSAKVALDEGKAARALTLLDRYDRRFPNGKLTNEARATRVLAHCVDGNSAAARAQATRLDPGSPLAKQLKAGCIER